MENKTKLYQKWWFWLCVVLIIIIFIICLFNNNKVSFKIEDFKIKKDVQEFEYIEDTVTYKGKGEIVTKDKKNTYLVAVKVMLKDGGNEDYEDYITTVLVEKGKGEITTYDSGELGKIDKPSYDFKIIGYLKFNK